MPVDQPHYKASTFPISCYWFIFVHCQFNIYLVLFLIVFIRVKVNDVTKKDNETGRIMRVQVGSQPHTETRAFSARFSHTH